MGVEGTCRSSNRGGALVLCSLYSLHPLSSSVLSLSCQSSGQKASERGETGQKLEFIWCALVFSREFGIPKRAKCKYILNFEGCRASVVALSLGRWRAHWSRGWQGFGASGPAGCWLCSSGGVFPAFVRFAALHPVRCLQIWLYFAF